MMDEQTFRSEFTRVTREAKDFEDLVNIKVRAMKLERQAELEAGRRVAKMIQDIRAEARAVGEHAVEMYLADLDAKAVKESVDA